MLKIDESACCSPILLLIYNRPDLTKRVFSSIRRAKPQKLFVAADGPRNDVPEDADMCERSRQVVNLVDWECEVHTLFRETNLGLKNAVGSAINWFFERVDAGIIIEDDCIPHPTFYSFCTELLERYIDEDRIMTITGDNFQEGRRRSQYSYYYSIYVHVWGWATWRNAWQHYDSTMDLWPALSKTSWLMDILESEEACTYWNTIFTNSYEGNIDSWAYPWIFSCWVHSGLSAVPNVNLVSNIGFDQRATHTGNLSSPRAGLDTEEMLFPLAHPPEIYSDRAADAFTFYNAIQSGNRSRLLRWARRKLEPLAVRMRVSR